MARCRCGAAECTCRLAAGINTVVSGDGSLEDPFRVRAYMAVEVQSSDSITVTAEGSGTTDDPLVFTPTLNPTTLVTQATLDAHINDATGAHPASAISYGGGSDLVADDVEEALDALAVKTADGTHGDIVISADGATHTIGAGAVTNEKIGNGAVSSTKIAGGDVVMLSPGRLITVTATILTTYDFMGGWEMRANVTDVLTCVLAGTECQGWATMTVEVLWTVPDANAGDAYWTADTWTIQHGSAVAFVSTATLVAAAPGAAATVRKSVLPVQSVPVTEVKGLRLIRTGTHASDTYPNTAQVMGILLRRVS